MFRLPFAMPVLVLVLAGFIVRSLVTLLIVYAGARLAIRHERRAAS